MKKLLITGSGGMVGRSVLEHDEAKNFDILKPRKNELDLLDDKSVFIYLKKNKPDIIIHCAGVVGGIQANIDNPNKFFYENLRMGLNIISASKNSGINKFLNIASSCMYPRNAQNPLKENLILDGELEPTNEGYALAKICLERFCKYIFKEDSDFIYKTLIPCNIYGKYDKFDPSLAHMIPGVIHRMHYAKKNKIDEIKIWGDGKAKREFMYSEDLADAIWFALNNIERLPQTTNIGIGEDYTILEYYKEIANVIDVQFNYKFDLTKPIGMARKLIDSSVINKLGWKPKYNLNKGISNTYKYYLSLQK